MPRYICHKQVWALRIKGITYLGGISAEDCNSAEIQPEEEGYAPFEVSDAYVQKHRPQIGGYYVVYKGGYESFSPATTFEEGYTRERS